MLGTRASQGERCPNVSARGIRFHYDVRELYRPLALTGEHMLCKYESISASKSTTCRVRECRWDAAKEKPRMRVKAGSEDGLLDDFWGLLGKYLCPTIRQYPCPNANCLPSGLNAPSSIVSYSVADIHKRGFSSLTRAVVVRGCP